MSGLKMCVNVFELYPKPTRQRAKNIVSDSPGPVYFAIGLLNFVLKLPDGQVKFFEEIKVKKNCEINSAHQMFCIIFFQSRGLAGLSFCIINLRNELITGKTNRWSVP